MAIFNSYVKLPEGMFFATGTTIKIGHGEENRNKLLPNPVHIPNILKWMNIPNGHQQSSSHSLW